MPVFLASSNYPDLILLVNFNICRTRFKKNLLSPINRISLPAIGVNDQCNQDKRDG